MSTIPYGETPEEKRAYAERVKTVATSYWENNAVCRPPGRNGTNVRLVEVWEKGGKVSIHESRNEIRWVADTSAKQTLNGIATDPNVMRMLSGGWHARAKRRPKGVLVKTHPKPLSVPGWAQQGNVIGYTCVQELNLGNTSPNASGILSLGAQGLHSLPSVYYTQGHATLDHQVLGNVGWEYGDGWQCLFLGNVPEKYL